MNNAQRTQLKQTILTAIDKQSDDILHLEEMTKPVAPDNAIGRLSRMEAINEKNVCGVNRCEMFTVFNFFV